MKISHCVTEQGEAFELRQCDNGTYCCPVCGSAEFTEPPYSEDGKGSFEMCSCGFEFGFDESPEASSDAVEGVQANWRRWRLRLIEEVKRGERDLAALEGSLERLDIRLAFDLIPVENRPNKSE